MKYEPLRLMSITRRNSAGVSRVAGTAVPTPALLISTSTLPSWSTVSATTRLQSSGLATSALTATHRRPRSCTRALVSSSLSTRRAQIATSAPASARPAADRLSVREPGAVSVFPIPGTVANLPGTQITFRGIAPRRIGPLNIVGSVTGVHVGRIEADSDGRGGSFIPSQPFAPGETVRVVSQSNVLGGHGGEFSFVIE